MLPIPAPAAMSLPPNQAYSLEMGLVTRQICYAADLYPLLYFEERDEPGVCVTLGVSAPPSKAIVRGRNVSAAHLNRRCRRSQ